MYEESVLWDGMREVLRGGGELTGGWLTVGRVRRQELGGKDTRVFAFLADAQHLVTAVRPELTLYRVGPQDHGHVKIFDLKTAE